MNPSNQNVVVDGGFAAWDEWLAVEESLMNTSNPKFTVVCFSHHWNIPSMHTALALDSIRTRQEAPGVNIFIINASIHQDKAYQFGVGVTPSLLFYSSNNMVKKQNKEDPQQRQPMIVRRPDYDDDRKWVGSAPKDILLEIIHTARDAADRRLNILSLDF